MPDNVNTVEEKVISCRLLPGALVHEDDPRPNWSIHIMPQRTRRGNVSSEGLSFRIEPIDDPLLQQEYEGESKLHIDEIDCRYYLIHRFQQISSTWKAPRIALLKGVKTG